MIISKNTRITEKICKFSIKMNFQIMILILTAANVILFQQNDYKFIIERVSWEWYNKDYIKDAKLVLYHYTRYVKRINGSMFLLQDIGEDITETLQAYKFQSNEYREFPVLYSGNGCDDVKLDTFGTSAVHYNTNFVGCPVKKVKGRLKKLVMGSGWYYVANVHFDDSKFPPFAPRGQFMLELALYYKKTILLSRMKVYIKIEPTNPLEKIIMN